MSDLQDVEQFKDREPAIGEVSRTFMCVSDQHHVSEADVAGRIFDRPHDFWTAISRNWSKPPSRDTLLSLID